MDGGVGKDCEMQRPSRAERRYVHSNTNTHPTSTHIHTSTELSNNAAVVVDGKLKIAHHLLLINNH